jgi:hypothetical protein
MFKLLLAATYAKGLLKDINYGHNFLLVMKSYFVIFLNNTFSNISKKKIIFKLEYYNLQYLLELELKFYFKLVAVFCKFGIFINQFFI